MAGTSCGKAHEPRPPQVSASEPTATIPDFDADDVSDRWLAGVRILELDLDRPELLDVRFDDCDLSGVIARDYVARRVAFRRTRLRGVALTNGQYDDGLLEDCPTVELSLRFSRLRNVIIRGCDLSGADFYSTTFDHVTIENCSLRGARFQAATVNCLRIINGDFAGVSGALSLRGAEVDADDLLSLAPSLAAEAGLVIHTEP